MEYSLTQILEILDFCEKYGCVATHAKYGTSESAIRNWMIRYRNSSDGSRAKYSPELKAAALEELKTSSKNFVARKYKIDPSTLYTWIREQHFADTGVDMANSTRKCKRTAKTPAQMIQILKFAGEYGVDAASKEYDVEPARIEFWNTKFKIFDSLQNDKSK